MRPWERRVTRYTYGSNIKKRKGTGHDAKSNVFEPSHFLSALLRANIVLPFDERIGEDEFTCCPTGPVINYYVVDRLRQVNATPTAFER